MNLPVAVKVGSVGVLGGGGIVGTGLLIHDQMKFKLTGLDFELVNDSEAVLGVDSSTKFTIGTGNSGTPTNQVTLEIKVTAIKESNSAKKDKWTCTITGIAKNESDSPETLTDTTNSGNFDKGGQTTSFTGKLGKDNGKKETQDGFVTSCARNRSKNPTEENDKWGATLILNLKKDSNQKWVFSEEDLESVFAGTYINPKQQ